VRARDFARDLACDLARGLARETRPCTRSRTRAALRVALPRPAMPPAKRSAAAMTSSTPVVSAASLTTLHQVLSCFLEPCPQGTSAVGAAKVYWHPIVDTLAWIMEEPATGGGDRWDEGHRTTTCAKWCATTVLRRPTLCLWAVRVRDTSPWTEPPVRRGRGRQHRSSSAARLGMGPRPCRLESSGDREEREERAECHLMPATRPTSRFS